MQLKEAITWTELNCNAEAVSRLRSRTVSATLLSEVRKLQLERDELLAALIAVRADLVMRAKLDSEDGGAVLNISNGVLRQMDAAITKVRP